MKVTGALQSGSREGTWSELHLWMLTLLLQGTNTNRSVQGDGQVVVQAGKEVAALAALVRGLKQRADGETLEGELDRRCNLLDRGWQIIACGPKSGLLGHSPTVAE